MILQCWKCIKCGESCQSLVDGPPARDENAIFDYAPINHCRNFVEISLDGEYITMRVRAKYVTSKEYFGHVAHASYPRLCKHEWVPLSDDEVYMKRELDKESGW